MTRRTWIATLPLLLLLVASCGSSRRRYHDTAMDFSSVKTVAVLPFANLSRDNLAGDRVRDVFSNMLLATGAFYVVPPGEVLRVIAKAGVAAPATPSVDEVMKLGAGLKVDAVITGVVKEYGEVRSSTSSANVVSISVQMQETGTGRVVWAAASTKGGVTMKIRLLGGGGDPLNDVTEDAVDDLIDQLFK